MKSNKAYMSRADVIVLLTAHLAPALIADHGAADSTPKRVVDFAIKLADELVAQEIVHGGDPHEYGGGKFVPEEDFGDETPEVTVSDTERPAPDSGPCNVGPEPELPKVSEAPPAPQSDFGAVHPDGFSGTDAESHLDNSAGK